MEHRSFDIIGSIALLRVPPGTGRKETTGIAHSIMARNKNVKSVYNRIGKTSGEERVASIRYIAGEKKTLTLHRENGCSLYVDVRRVYFSPRLSNERLRIIGLVKKGENVLDMFCGVGPYTVEIAKKVQHVYSIDINKAAVDLLGRNLDINHIKNVDFECGDSKKIIPKLKDKFDRVIMNFPMDAKSFIRYALKAVAKNSTIHVYAFAKRNNGDEEKLKKEICKNIGKEFRVVSIKSYRTGEVAPFVDRLCFDVRLKKKD